MPFQSLPIPRSGMPPVTGRRPGQLRRLPSLEGLPLPVALRWFHAPPSRFRPPWGLSGSGSRRAFARRSAPSCAWPALGVSCSVNSSAARRRRTTLCGFLPLRHLPATRIRYPRDLIPGTFRPQGLTTLSATCSPCCLATARRPPQRPWGSPFRALLPPAGGTPLGAAPLMSFLRRTVILRPRLQRTTPAGEGNGPSHP